MISDDLHRSRQHSAVVQRAARAASSVILGMASCGLALPAMGQPPCTAPERPLIILDTVDGVLEIELIPEAAPAAVQQLSRLVAGPIFRDELTASGPQREVTGYFDGLSFDHARPGTELATGLRPPHDAFLIATQIDAAALGLDERRLASSAEAMAVWQHEILPYETAQHGRRATHPLLEEWLAAWRQSMRPDFLLEVSQKEINEVLGYRYVTGLPSLPVRRGAVSLGFDAKEWSTPRLVIALTDRPELDGRRMVVGRVVAGLELADAISRRRLTPAKSDANRPLVPVRITDGRLVSGRSRENVGFFPEPEEDR